MNCRRTCAAWRAAALVVLCLASCRPASPPRARAAPEQAPRRIISLSPAITEILFAIGCGGQVVGVTSFCKHPPAAARLPKVGGFYDTNYELVLSLQPDLVLHAIEHEAAAQNLQALGLECRALSLLSLPDIMASIRRAGELCHAAAPAEALADDLQARMDAVRARIPAGAPAPAVLVCIGRNMGTGGLADVYLAGPGTIYGEMLQLLGARNVYQGRLAYAQVGREGILRMNPGVIVDLAPDLDVSNAAARARLLADWNQLTSVDAVRQQRIYVLDGDYVCIPGPRIARTLADLAAAIYPDAAPEEAP